MKLPICSIALLVAESASGQLSFRGTGVASNRPPYLTNRASISANGDVAALTVYVDPIRTRALRWSAELGATLLPVPGDNGLRKHPESYCTDISADGSRIVGCARLWPWEHLCVWGDDEMPVPLEGAPDNPYQMEILQGISDDGVIVAGYSQNRPSVWKNCEGPVRLPLPTGYTFGQAISASCDGSVVVGYARANGKCAAVRWINEGSVEVLYDAADVQTNVIAIAVSADGNTVVGHVTNSDSAARPFRWTSAKGLEMLEVPGRMWSARAKSVSDDGAIVVGWSRSIPSYDYSNDNAALWDRTGQYFEVRDVLARLGVRGFEDWRLLDAEDISADGSTIVGVGINPDGLYEHWIARIGPHCPGDVDGNGIVELADLGTILAHLGLEPAAARAVGDLDDDNDVDVSDLLQALGNFGGSCIRN